MASSPTLAKSTNSPGHRRKGGPRRDLMETELLDCAAALFAEKGFGATSLQEIAGAAGVGRTTLYYYFRSKDDFLTALVEDVTVGASEQILSICNNTQIELCKKLHMIAEALVIRQLSRAVRFRVLDREENNLPPALRKRHRAAKREVLAEVSRLIEAGISSGEFRTTDTNIAALSFIGICNWTAWWFKPGEQRSIQDVAAIVAELAVGALLPQRSIESRSATPVSIIADMRLLLDQLEKNVR